MYDELDEYDELIKYEAYAKHRPKPPLERRPRRNLSHKQMKERSLEQSSRTRTQLNPKIGPTEAFFQLAEGDTKDLGGFHPTIGSLSSSKTHLSNHEREWILTYLGAFYNDQMILDVLRRVKGGKEATVYCCKANPTLGVDLVAGKVYHERKFRSLKNDSVYRQGRAVLDDQGKGIRGRRELLAMKKKTGFGQEMRHYSWLANEFTVLTKLYEAGADVPKPFTHSENAMLMEYIGDTRWAAPTLAGVSLTPKEARPLFDRLMHNVELMLGQEIIHGDLSAFNVLYWEGQVKIIDFPQAVNPFANPDAYQLFSRDVARLCQYFARYGVEADAVGITAELWARCIPS